MLWICALLAAGVCSFFPGEVEDDARDEERRALGRRQGVAVDHSRREG
jgi:hypothetical protein